MFRVYFVAVAFLALKARGVAVTTSADAGTTTCITFDYPSETNAGTTTDSAGVGIPGGGTPTVTLSTPTVTESRTITQTVSPSSSLFFTCWTYIVPETTSTGAAFRSASTSDAGTTTDPVDVPGRPTASSTHYTTYTVCI
ncbi:hypothetical protein R3P38DRAFT_3175107 [Favolaschia claudopus]|uniref:Uncharacterized protein n=1 Tax=Favolaschia claudopus TaxID=2862362 RepID=A0AAW0DCK4_9AGAR